MNIKKEYFITDDNVELFGLLHTSDKKTEKEVIISTHGMGSNCMKKRDDIIAQKMTENGISYFTYNNRGYGMINSVNKGKEKILQGTAYEDIEDSYYDILGAINHMINLGYEKIHLQGHSLGSTKTVYTYNKLQKENNIKVLEKIKSIILLSLVDIPSIMNYFIKQSGLDIIKITQEKIKNDELDYIINTKVPFLPLVSVKTFLKYYKNNEIFDFAKYKKDNFQFEILNNIKVPLYMRWGNVNELIELPAEELVKLMNEKIKNDKKDINFIDSATHNYKNKEQILAGEIYAFIKEL